jgi:hypothetical protein
MPFPVPLSTRLIHIAAQSGVRMTLGSDLAAQIARAQAAIDAAPRPASATVN